MLSWSSTSWVKGSVSSTSMNLGSARKISDARAGDHATSPIQLEPRQLLPESPSWLLLTLMAPSFLPWAKWIRTLTLKDTCCMSSAMLSIRTDPTGERRQYAFKTTHRIIVTHSPRSTSGRREFRWSSRQSIATMPHPASSSSLTSREILSMKQPPRQENCKYIYFSLFCPGLLKM